MADNNRQEEKEVMEMSDSKDSRYREIHKEISARIPKEQYDKLDKLRRR